MSADYKPKIPLEITQLRSRLVASRRVQKEIIQQCEYWADWRKLDESEKEDTIAGYEMLFEFGFDCAYEQLQKENEDLKERINEAIKYCGPHTNLMWAASVIGILTCTDFKDAKAEYDKMKGIK